MKILRIIALFLTVAILFSSCAFDYSVAINAEDVMNFDCEELGVAEVTSSENSVVAELIVEGTTVSCKYDRSNEAYTLTIDENQYPLEIAVKDDNVFIGFADSVYELEEEYTDGVIGQAALAGALAYGYLSPVLLKAAVTLLEIILDITVAATAYYSLVLLATTISDVRDGSLTLPRVRPRDISKADWRVATKQVAKIEKAKPSTSAEYYNAMLYEGVIFIDPHGISYSKAMRRVSLGYDIFASTYSAARRLGRNASPTGKIKEHQPHHGGSDGYYPHVHPVGVRRRNAISNDSYVHIWFPCK